MSKDVKLIEFMDWVVGTDKLTDDTKGLVNWVYRIWLKELLKSGE